MAGKKEIVMYFPNEDRLGHVIYNLSKCQSGYERNPKGKPGQYKILLITTPANCTRIVNQAKDKLTVKILNDMGEAQKKVIQLTQELVKILKYENNSI